MPLRVNVWISIFAMQFYLSSGCHGVYDDHAEHKRSLGQVNNSVTVQDYFPSCISSFLTSNPNYTSRNWKGAVDYAVFHSSWYEVANLTGCAGSNDTAECWLNNVAQFIRKRSPALRAVQNCIVSYSEIRNNVTHNITVFPEGVDFEESENCSNVSVSDYAVDFLAEVNISEFEAEDEILANYGDLIEFAEYDLVCTDCQCDDLAENDEYFEIFELEDENSCSDCWYSRLAAETKAESPIKDATAKATFKRGALTQKTTCPRIMNFNYSDLEAVRDVLNLKLQCKPSGIHVSLEACGLVQLGYRKASEVYLTDPTTAFDIFGTGPKKCRTKIRRSNSEPNETVDIAVINTNKENCNPLIQTNITHGKYTYALRNRVPDDDLYIEDIILERRVNLDINISCWYQLDVIQLRQGITTLQRSITLDYPDQSSPMQIIMSVFRDPNFSDPLTSNDSTVLVPDPVWVKLQLEGANDLILHVNSCWLMVEGFEVAVIISGGCPMHNSSTSETELVTCESTEASFRFNTFYISSGEISVECSVETFGASEPACSQIECGDESSRRRRRYLTSTDRQRYNIGLTLHSNLRDCEQGVCDCQEICLGCDSQGNPYCECRDADYVLQNDGKTCQPVVSE